jgi:hypothetical protein
MKITKEYQNKIGESLKALIDKFGSDEISNYINNIDSTNVKDLNTRIVWDLIRISYRVLNKDYYNDLVKDLYSLDCNDSHITTALKSEAKKLNIIQ